MGKQSSSSIQAPWIPQTPLKKPVSVPPICPNSTEEQFNHRIQTEERKRFEMNSLDHLSFGDLLALANTASVYFSGNMVSGDMLQKGNNNETVESLSSVSNNNNIAEQIKTPEKPKRKKHRPKVVREAKPKKKPVAAAANGSESKTSRRKYVRKKQEVVDKDQESTPTVESAALETKNTQAKKPCRRALDFEDGGENQLDEKESGSREKQLDSGNQESEDCLLSVPSTSKRKRSQSRRAGNQPKENGGIQEGADLSVPQAAKKRQGKEPTSDVNLPGIQYDALCDYQKMHWLHFTNLPQEGMRPDDVICSTSFTGQRLDAQEEFNANRVLTMEEKDECTTFQETQHFESNVCFDKIDTPIKKRPTGHARFRNLSAINKDFEHLPGGCNSRPPQNDNNKVLVEPRVTLSKKKRPAKSEKTVLPNLCQFPASFAGGLSPDEMWKQSIYHSVEEISEQLRILDINREIPFIVQPRQFRGNEMILYRGGPGAIVPLTPVKKRHARAKVDLDNETDRVWKLLMDNINSEGIDGSDEQKAKWWEEERNVFKGRADSFIARMHLVQGDRRFTPWKGSVVDSVVGVFLTQNVSDHLSSSAFMSLASEFPAHTVPRKDFDVGTSSTPSIRITYLDSEESMSNPPVHNQSSVALNNTQPNVENDNVNSDESSRSSSEIASSVHESVGKTTDSKAADVDKTDVNRKDSSVDKTDPFPSEDSVITSLVSDAPKHTERTGSSSEINSNCEHKTSFLKLLQDLGSALVKDREKEVFTADTVSVQESNHKNQCENSRQELWVSSSQVSPNTSPGDCSSEVKDFKTLKRHSDDSNDYYQQPESSSSVRSTKNREELVTETTIPDVNESTRWFDVQEGAKKTQGPMDDDVTMKAKGKKEKKEEFDWDSLRRDAEVKEGKREKTSRTMDTVDWEAIRMADVSEVAETIKSRGMNHKLAERIQAFLNRLVTEHGSINLEWLRDVPPDKAKEYLLSVRGLGLKSVECVRLLTLHHLAFPVDTNVGRIAVRLGWVPLQPLPESLQLHLLEMYPVLESIQKYLWPRLCKLDQKTLYELHYQMITFGKVFCTKSKPNCNACPMRGECRHFASAFASARLSLPGTEKSTATPDKNPLPLRLPEPLQREQGSEVVKQSEPAKKVTCCEPIIEVPASPEPECAQVSIEDIEDAFYEDPEEIPTIRLNMDAFTSNLKKIMEHHKELQEGNMSTALVALTAQAASIPMPKLKNISQLRTEHQVYELPDTHPLLAELEDREPDDPCSYLLSIWTPGETVDSIQPSVSKCISQEIGKLCDEETCFSCNSIKEARSQTVRGTILIPCRTAMRGSFPLNGTYFQVNEVFADHVSSLRPIDVPREWLWDLPRRTVYFGTSIPSIFKGLSTETIQQCFWRGYVCVRGFDRKTRGPKPLIARLHFPASRMKSQANNNTPNPGGK